MDRSLLRQNPLRKRNNLELSWLEPVVANAGPPRRNFAVRIGVGKGTAAAPIGVRFQHWGAWGRCRWRGIAPRTAPKRVTGWFAASTLTSPVPGSGKPSRCSVHQAIGPVRQCNFSDRKIVARSPEVYPQAGGGKIVTDLQNVLIR